MVDAGEDCNNLARPFSHDRTLGLLWTAACVASVVELLKVEAFCLGERSDQTQTMHCIPSRDARRVLEARFQCDQILSPLQRGPCIEESHRADILQ